MIESNISNQRPYFFQFLYAGIMFNATAIYAMPANGTIFVEFIVPATKVMHLINRSITVDKGGPYTVELFEAPTVTDGTTEFTCYNLDRRSTNLCTGIFYTNPTAVSGGTLLFRNLIATGDKKNGIGGSAAAGEFIYKANTKYVLRILNGSNEAATISLDYTWYESTN